MYATVETGPGQHRGELCWPASSSWALSLARGPLPLVGTTVGLRGVVRLSATVRLHALVGKKDGHTFAPAPSLPLPAGGLPGGFKLRLKRTSARYDRARRPLDRVSEGVLGGRLQATHCGSPLARSRTNVHKDQPTTPAGTTPPSSPTPDTQRLHLPNSTEGSPTLNPATLIPTTWRGGTTSRLPLTAHNAGDSSRNDKALDSLRKQELSSRLEDAECARHRTLESQVGPRHHTTSLRLHQSRLPGFVTGNVEFIEPAVCRRMLILVAEWRETSC
ncbi:hypothetical protein THAOC_12636 [Thalassiosira oceanica]|uniref:Uncharacterized protein n=1 Tax=Thalassiosira oceanica TaxID=159749 RepID=K0SN78_THAOC|nr:hypothetical protein THAOC_12636 [Thalassiosira oceanica]|eukprot:EJK66449.1 hypothetical protein THAOC_12636 [Thalassiosira oceanica]